MDLRILNAQFMDTKAVDSYFSRIWVTKYSEYGNFEIQVLAGSDLAAYFRSGEYIVDKDTNIGMFIENEETITDTEDAPLVTFTGRSFEQILERRIVWGAKTISGNIQTIIHELIDESIINPAISDRQIENFVFQKSGDLRFDDFNLSEPIDLNGDNLYDVVKLLCNIFGAGFRITFDSSLKQFIFELYCGRLLDGSAYDGNGPVVEFSPGYENLHDSRYLLDTQNYKSVALISSTLEMMAEQQTDDEDGSSGITNIIAKTNSVISYSLESGRKIAVRFHKKVNAGATLNVNFTGAKPIYYNGSPIQNDIIKGGNVILFEYDGTRYITIGEYSDAEQVTERIDQVVTSSVLDSIGINRREVFVEASVSIEEDTTRDKYQTAMQEQGYETLAEHLMSACMDGQVISEGPLNYVFGRDYKLGDIVLVDNYLGNRGSARITEYMQSDDANEGETAYPTFSIIS